MKFYVIHLERNIERKVALQKHLDSLGVNYEFFKAIDGKCLSKEELSLCDSQAQNILEMKGGRKLIIEDKLSAPELGCALSHLKAYQHILDSGEEQAVIIEDDVLINQKAIEAINNISIIQEPWDIINFSSHIGIKDLPFAKKYYFGDNKDMYFKRIGMRNITLDSIFNRRRVIVSSVMYIVSKFACQKLITLGYPVRIPSDYLLGIIAYNELKMFRVYPLNHFLSYDQFESTIEYDRPRHRLVKC